MFFAFFLQSREIREKMFFEKQNFMRVELKNSLIFWRLTPSDAFHKKLSRWYRYRPKLRKWMWHNVITLIKKKRKEIKILRKNKIPKREKPNDRRSGRKVCQVSGFAITTKVQKNSCDTYFMAYPFSQWHINPQPQNAKNHQQCVKMNFNTRNPAGGWNPLFFSLFKERK